MGAVEWMTSSTSSSSDASSALSGTIYPLIAPKPEESSKKDWVKIGSIVAMVAGAIIAALAVLCIMGIFPHNLLGGPIQTGITLIAGGAILLPAAYVFYDRWKSQP